MGGTSPGASEMVMSESKKNRPGCMVLPAWVPPVDWVLRRPSCKGNKVVARLQGFGVLFASLTAFFRAFRRVVI